MVVVCSVSHSIAIARAFVRIFLVRLGSCDIEVQNFELNMASHFLCVDK